MFKCMRCMDCCKFTRVEDSPIVFPWEKRLLIEKASRMGIGGLIFEPYLIYYDESRNISIIVLYKWIIKGLCPFNKNGLCSIHGEHPLACRMYPLIIGVDDNTLRVSMSCKWVRDHKDLVISHGRPDEIFPYEYKNAITAFILIKGYIDYMDSKGLVRVREILDGSRVVDIDKYIDMVDQNDGLEEGSRGDKGRQSWR